MKAILNLNRFVVLAILLSGSAALAQSQTQPQTTPAAPTALRSQSARSADKNRDGKVDATERATALTEYRQQRDQELKMKVQAAAESRKAVIAARYARQKLSPKVLEQYDRNRNGEMDPHKWERFRQDMAKLRQ